MSRSSRHVARDRITSSRLSRQLASGGARHLFFAGYQKQPRHRAADDRRSQSNADRVPAIARIAPFPPSSPSVSPVLSSFLSLSSFSLFTLLALSRSCVSYVRTNSISRDSLRSGSTVNYFSSSRSRLALLRTCASSSLPASRIPDSGSLSSSSLKPTP